MALVSPPVLAAGLVLQNLDSEDFKAVVNEFSANLTQTSVAGASTLDGNFGFRFGIVTGRTSTPKLNRLVQEVNPDRQRESLPHIHLLGEVKFPLGLMLETGFMPKIGTNDFKYTTFALAAKWTPTNVWSESAVHFAVKGHLQKSYVEFDYNLNNTPTRYEYRGVVSGLTAYLSADIAPMIEPYLAIGVVNGSGELKTAGSNTVFSDPTFASNSSAKAAVNSPLYLVGIDFKMGAIGFGLEYSRQFNVDTYNGKFVFVP